jgi:hypothetical protein
MRPAPPGDLCKLAELNEGIMSVRDLIPWARSDNQIPTVFRDGDRDPFLSLHREVNRLFDDVWRSFDSRFPALDWMPL